MFVLGSRAFAEEPLPSEYQVKAAFIVNFPKYVEWPAEAFKDANSPIVLAVIGESKVSDEIEKAVVGKTINGRKLTFKRLASGEDTGGCHILFIPAAEERHLPELFTKLKGVAVLTVGESDNFLISGGAITLVRRDQKIALEISLNATANAHLKVSSKLLGVASVVKGKYN